MRFKNIVLVEGDNTVDHSGFTEDGLDVLVDIDDEVLPDHLQDELMEGAHIVATSSKEKYD
jgi:hypothetical protein